MDNFLKFLYTIENCIIYLYNDIKSAISKIWNDLIDILKNRNININFGDFDFSVN